MSFYAPALRVQLVITSIVGGGAEAQVALLAQELERRGHEVSTASLLAPASLENGSSTASIPFENLGMRRGQVDPRALWRYARLVRAFKPDIVHGHMFHANLLSRLARILVSFPVQISTAHNFDEGVRWRNVAYRISDPLCSLTTTVCERCVDSFLKSGAVPKRRIRYIPNGLEFSSIDFDPVVRRRKRAELGLDDETFLWLAVGRLEKEKDYPNMVRAVAELSNRPGRVDFRVLVAGEGSLRAQLVSQLAEYGAQEHVEFLGQRDDVAALMSAADGFVMSSSSEGLPMVLLEAAGTRLPAVATDVGGNREIIHDGETGLLVKPYDSPALANAMYTMSSFDPGRRAAIGRLARSRAERDFGIKSVVDLWEATYHELLEKRLFSGR